MFYYQLNFVVRQDKFDEFIDALYSLSKGIQNEHACHEVGLYRDLQKRDDYRFHVEWKTRQAMEGHFKREQFSVLIGAAKVLGEDFEMSIGETLEKGSYQFAQEKISLDPGKDKMLDTKS